MIFKTIICAIALYTLNFSVEAGQSGEDQISNGDKLMLIQMYDAIEECSTDKFKEALDSLTNADSPNVFSLYLSAKSKSQLEIANLIKESNKLNRLFTPPGYRKFFLEVVDTGNPKLVKIALEFSIDFPLLRHAHDKNTIDAAIAQSEENSKKYNDFENNDKEITAILKRHQGIPPPL